jgi:hypothetical protein
MRRRSLVIASVSVGYAVAIVACGGAAERTIKSDLGERSIAPKSAPPVTRAIGLREIDATPPSSAQRAFLSMWSDLQRRSWNDAMSSYQAGLIAQIGRSNLLRALEFNALLFRTAKPTLEGQTSNSGRVTIHYAVSGPQVRRFEASITWSQENGRWIVYYDPILDLVLRAWAQAQAQEKIDPNARKPSQQAIAAGIRAAETQERYLGSKAAGRQH